MYVGVLGLGKMGENHLRVYRELGMDVLTYDTDHGKRFVAEDYGSEFCSDLDTLLNSVKAVSVCTPTSTHKDLAVKSLEYAKGVLVEKPLAATVEDAEEILRYQNGNILAVGHIEIYNPVVTKLKDLLEGQEIYSSYFNRTGPHPPRIKDCGVVLDLATHDLGINKFLINKDVRSVSAITTNPSNNAYEEEATITLQLEDGTMTRIDASWLTAVKERTLKVPTLVGNYLADFQIQTLDRIIPEEEYYKDAEDYKNYEDLMRKTEELRSEEIEIEKAEPLKLELEHFIDCVRTGDQPLVSGEDGLEVVRLAHYALESARQKRTIEIS